MSQDKRESRSELCYKKNFLREVIARIDFVSPNEAIKKELPKKVANIAIKRFPIDEPKPIIVQTITIGKDKRSFGEKQEFRQWNFFGKNREKKLVIDPGALYVTYKEYDKYKNLRDDFNEIVKVYCKSFENMQPSRLGLRYVNEIKIDEENPLKWNKYISEKLLKMFSFKVDNAKPARIFHNLEYVYDTCNLVFKFGIDNPDYPAPIRKKYFILDYDAYYKGAVEPLEVETLLDTFHERIQNLFEKSILEGTRDLMDEKE